MRSVDVGWGVGRIGGRSLSGRDGTGMRRRAEPVKTTMGRVAVRWLLVVVAGWSGCGARPEVALQSVDPRERARAAVAIAKRGDRSAIPLLVDRLEDVDPAVRFYAIQALHRLTGEDFGYRYYDREESRLAAVRRWREYVRKRAWVEAERGQSTSAPVIGRRAAEKTGRARGEYE